MKGAIDNGDVHAKKLVRNWALEQAGGKKARVLELFGGTGVMHDLCYQNVAKHLAFDLKAGEGALQGDNRVLLKNNVEGWTLYDADAYSMPWIVLSDVCRLRAPGPFVMVATCYSARTMIAGKMHPFMRMVSGYDYRQQCPLLRRFYPDIICALFRYWKKYGVVVEQVKMIRANMTHRQSGHGFYYAIKVNKS